MFYFAFLALDKTLSSKELESRWVKKSGGAKCKSSCEFHTSYNNWLLPYQFQFMVIIINVSDTYEVLQYKR